MNTRRAFTLIEVLVVIGILSGFIAMLLPNFMLARQKARDARRKSDLKEIQKAIELYKQSQTLPVAPDVSIFTVCNELTDGVNVYMKKMPGDPLSSCTMEYSYVRNVDDTSTYTLAACLEDGKDSEAVNCPTGHFPGVTGYSCTSTKCFVLTNLDD